MRSKTHTAPKKQIPHINLLLNYIETLKPTLRHHSYQCYISHIRSLSVFCEANSIESLQTLDAHQYRNYLLTSISNAYTNSRIAALRRDRFPVI